MFKGDVNNSQKWLKRYVWKAFQEELFLKSEQILHFKFLNHRMHTFLFLIEL